MEVVGGGGGVKAESTYIGGRERMDLAFTFLSLSWATKVIHESQT